MTVQDFAATHHLSPEVRRTQQVGGESIAMCFLPDNTRTPYVTWRYSHSNPSFYWGYYWSTEAAALENYQMRVDDLVKYMTNN